MVIAFTKTKLSYGWMSNMSAFPVQYDGKTWRTAEALFQALRFDAADVREAIRTEKSPMGAKIKAKQNAEKFTVVPTSEKDVVNMEMVLRLKLDQHPQLKAELKATGDQLIVEDVSNRANGRNLFWGAAIQNGEWYGKNVLGNLWMKLREELGEALIGQPVKEK